VDYLEEKKERVIFSSKELRIVKDLNQDHSCSPKTFYQYLWTTIVKYLFKAWSGTLVRSIYFQIFNSKGFIINSTKTTAKLSGATAI
jgi:hypothetical protein